MADAKISISVMTKAFEPEKEVLAFRREHAKAGAIVTFLGQVRDNNGDTEMLTLEHYADFAEAAIDQFAEAAAARWPLEGLSIIHRVGELRPGDPIVFVAAASSHRRDAFEAVDYIMDYLKSEAPFWKQECANGQTRWIEPRQQDHADKARWRAAK